LGWWLDLMIFEVFSNLNELMILWEGLCGASSQTHPAPGGEEYRAAHGNGAVTWLGSTNFSGLTSGRATQPPTPGFCCGFPHSLGGPGEPQPSLLPSWKVILSLFPTLFFPPLYWHNLFHTKPRPGAAGRPVPARWGQGNLQPRHKLARGPWHSWLKRLLNGAEPHPEQPRCLPGSDSDAVHTRFAITPR